MVARTEQNYIRTYTGKKFWPLDPRPEDVDIVDIAHALSNQCRFTGHTRHFYSVAEHSLLVSALCLNSDKLPGLLHDADEAYLVDLATPVKHAPEFEFFVAAAKRLNMVVLEAFGLDSRHADLVKHVDKQVYEIERNMLMPTGNGQGAESCYALQRATLTPHAPMLPKEAERAFLDEFYVLRTEKNVDRYPQDRR